MSLQYHTLYTSIVIVNDIMHVLLESLCICYDFCSCLGFCISRALGNTFCLNIWYVLRLNNCAGLALATNLKAIQDDRKDTDCSIENQSYISAGFKVNPYSFKEGCSVFEERRCVSDFYKSQRQWQETNVHLTTN